MPPLPNVYGFGMSQWGESGSSLPSQFEKGKYCRLVIELGPARLNWRVKVVCCGKLGESGYVLGGQFVTNELDPTSRSDFDSAGESPHIME